MQKSNATLLFAIGFLALAACGGGGSTGGPPAVSATGSATSPPTTPSTVAPSPTATASLAPGTLSKATQRTDAQVALFGLKPFALEERLGETQNAIGASASARRRFGHRAQHHRAAATMPSGCQDAVSGSSSTSGSTTTFMENVFYDSACTMIWQTINGTDTSSNAGQTATIAANDQVYNISGVPSEVDTINATESQSQNGDMLSANASVGPYAGQPTGQIAADCNDTFTASGTNESCSFGNLDTFSGNILYTGLGNVENVTDTIVDNSDGSFATTGTGTITFYQGTAPPIMKLQNNGTAVTLTDAALMQTFGETFSVQGPAQGQPTYTQSVSDYNNQSLSTVTISNYACIGSIAGSAGTIQATYNLDINGNGSITYGDGTTGTVSGFDITS